MSKENKHRQRVKRAVKRKSSRAEVKSLTSVTVFGRLNVGELFKPADTRCPVCMGRGYDICRTLPRACNGSGRIRYPWLKKVHPSIAQSVAAKSHLKSMSKDEYVLDRDVATYCGMEGVRPLGTTKFDFIFHPKDEVVIWKGPDPSQADRKKANRAVKMAREEAA